MISRNPSNDNLKIIVPASGSYTVPEGERWAVWYVLDAKVWLDKPLNKRGTLAWNEPGDLVTIHTLDGQCVIVENLLPKNEWGDVYP